MNYCEFHLGDYAKAADHLSMIEHGAYFGLLRKYYSSEKPLPPDLNDIQRLVGARIVLQNALVAMCRDRPAGPVARLKRTLQLRAGRASKTNKQSRLEDSNAAVVASLLTGGDSPQNAQTALEAANAAVMAELLKQA